MNVVLNQVVPNSSDHTLTLANCNVCLCSTCDPILEMKVNLCFTGTYCIRPESSQRRRKAYRVGTPREEHSFLSQKDPQPKGRQILMDSRQLKNSRCKHCLKLSYRCFPVLLCFSIFNFQFFLIIIEAYENENF